MASRSNYGFFWNFNLLVILFSFILIAGCPLPLKHMKFNEKGNSEKKYTIEFSNELQIEMTSIYWGRGPGVGFHLNILVENDNSIKPYIFKPENITVSFNGKSLYWDKPARDSIDLRITENSYFISLSFYRGELHDNDVNFLKNTKYPIRIALNNFIFINDSAIFIDTVFATSPELEYYDSW